MSIPPSIPIVLLMHHLFTMSYVRSGLDILQELLGAGSRLPCSCRARQVYSILFFSDPRSTVHDSWQVVHAWYLIRAHLYSVRGDAKLTKFSSKRDFDRPESTARRSRLRSRWSRHGYLMKVRRRDTENSCKLSRRTLKKGSSIKSQ